MTIVIRIVKDTEHFGLPNCAHHESTGIQRHPCGLPEP